MNDLPKDPFMLLSWVNMKLRDRYESLQALCDDLDIDPREITAKLAAAGFDYMPEINPFK
jgi:hypothetical protein